MFRRVLLNMKSKKFCIFDLSETKRGAYASFFVSEGCFYFFRC